MFDRLVADLGAQHIGEVCRVFLENATAEVNAVRQALGAGDAAGAADAAHRLKSSSGFLGATGLAELCDDVQAGSPAGDTGDALAAELRRASADLDVLLGRLARPTR